MPSAGLNPNIRLPLHPFGIHVIDGNLQNDYIHWPNPNRLGKICVGGFGGVSACLTVAAGSQSTWGGIKAQYR